MIDRQHGCIVFECEGCGETLDTGEGEWEDAYAMFKTEGWATRRDGDEWSHYCPSCKRTRGKW